MTQLMVHGQKADTVFELLGSKENAMTYSLGWALSRCDVFCQKLAAKLGLHEGFSDAMHIRLQEHESQKGFTDIEIVDPGRFHIVIEAKRGFNIPSPDQLEKYADRLLAKDNRAKKMLLVLAESDREEQWLSRHAPSYVNQVEVQAISWKQFQEMAQESVAKATRHSEKRLLRQFIGYLEKVTTMQNQASSYVYVVSASHDVCFKDAGISFVDVIEKHNKYFHPVGNRWPIEPPNYIAFRYDGKLQSIHHIESYEVIEDFQEHFNLPSAHPAGGEHYLYELGPAIRPAKEVRTLDKTRGYTQIQKSARCWCFIDLLFTCDSISEASVKTKLRENSETA
ncbi:MAG: PD-(D/E)XK nuclease family protein [Gammaproteobacteria bacterium]|nr:PD-(D/E)XK nuclease family protein [Gammaproteobacteria bacterium]